MTKLTTYLDQVKQRLDKPQGQDLQSRHDLAKFIRVVEVMRDTLENIYLERYPLADRVAKSALAEVERLVSK